MSRPDGSIFASTKALSPDASWEVRSDLFAEEMNGELNDAVAGDWEPPYRLATEDSADEWSEYSDEYPSGQAAHWDEADNEERDQYGAGEHWGDGASEAVDTETLEETGWASETTAAPPPSITNTLLVADYPRYATRVTDLRPDLVARIKAFANAVVGALLANHQVIVIVEGFADFDAKGRDFEQQVSIDRAMSARKFIVDEVHRMARATRLPTAALKRFSVQSVGFGSRRPSVNHPQSEDDRRQNRRIHIVWQSTPLPRAKGPSFGQALGQAERALGRIRRPGPKRRLTCLIAKLRDSRTADGYFSYDTLRAFPGSAGWPRMSPQEFDLMVKATTFHARAQIRSIAAASRNESELATHLETLDDTIGRNIFNFEQQLVGDSSTGVLMRTFNATIGRLQLDQQSILSCYAVYARIRHDQ
jgi:outer membrane protein OmpA-like peptidoglycan-associated protein